MEACRARSCSTRTGTHSHSQSRTQHLVARSWDTTKKTVRCCDHFWRYTPSNNSYRRSTEAQQKTKHKYISWMGSEDEGGWSTTSYLCFGTWLSQIDCR